jgi:antitoxin (DNA-binding transcriptional repressor) of toxin-antitoxin stability system
MPVTATQFRKNLFRLLDDVALGQELEVTHKGITLRITPAMTTSRLSRLIQREDRHLNPETSGWDAQVREEWEAEQRDLLGE